MPNEHDYIQHGESDEAPDVLAGDLHVRIFIKKHDVFQRKGADLFIEKKITLLEALTGTNFEVKHLDGANLRVATSPGEIINNSDIKTVFNKGMPFFKDQMSYGNLFIQFKVEFP